MKKTLANLHKRDDIARIVADLHGVTPRYVRMVKKGIRVNEEISASLIEYEVGKNKLIKEIESLIPLNNHKHGRKKN